MHELKNFAIIIEELILILRESTYYQESFIQKKYSILLRVNSIETGRIVIADLPPWSDLVINNIKILT